MASYLPDRICSLKPGLITTAELIDRQGKKNKIVFVDLKIPLTFVSLISYKALVMMIL